MGYNVVFPEYLDNASACKQIPADKDLSHKCNGSGGGPGVFERDGSESISGYPQGLIDVVFVLESRCDVQVFFFKDGQGFFRVIGDDGQGIFDVIHDVTDVEGLEDIQGI